MILRPITTALRDLQLRFGDTTRRAVYDRLLALGYDEQEVDDVTWQAAYDFREQEGEDLWDDLAVELCP